ncbi:MAG: PQQ-dependent sugar dehydrogenase, partial [bacterium]
MIRRLRPRRALGAKLRYGVALLWLCAASASAESALPTPKDKVRIEAVVGGLDQPWSLAFLPDGSYLVTERGGRLLRFANGRRAAVAGVPQVYARGQGGLLDVVAARDFAVSREVFLSYAKPMRGGGGTALAAARLSDDGGALENLRVLFEMRHGESGGRHFGSRIVEADDGALFLS